MGGSGSAAGVFVMASPQLENGFTRIANELLEALIRFPFSQRQLRLVLALARATYGWQSKVARLPKLRLATLTGLRPDHVYRELRELRDMKVVTEQDRVMGLNKNYEEWTRPNSGLDTNRGYVITQVGSSRQPKSGLVNRCGSVTGMGNRTPKESTKESTKERRGVRTPPPLPSALELATKDLVVLRLPPRTLHRYLATYNGKIDLAFELRRADGWCQDNPQRAPRKGHTAFMTRWLNRACEQPLPRDVPPQQVGPTLREEDFFLDGCFKSPESAARHGKPFTVCTEHRGAA